MNESSQEKEETRKSQRLRDKATAAAAEAKYSSDISVENIPSVRPRKSVKSSSRTENLPSGLVKSKVRRTPIPQSKQIKSHPSSEGREYIGSHPSSEARSHPSSEGREYIGSHPSSEARSHPSSEGREYIGSHPSSEARSYPSSEVIKSESDLSEQFQFEPSTAESSAREVPIQHYEKFEAAEEEEFTTSRPASSYIDPDHHPEEFHQQPEEEVFYKWRPPIDSPLSPIPESNSCLDWKVELDSEGSDQYFDEKTSSSSSSENFRMAQPEAPKYVQTIPIAANIQPFRGLRADGELHFQPGSDVRTWLNSVDAYFLAAGITQDAEKIAKVSTLVDRSCGDAAVVVARTATEFHAQTWAALREALISHYSDFKISDPLTQMEQFMNTRTPIKNIQQLPMLLLKTREKVDSLVEAYLGLPAFSQTPAAQIPDLKKALKRFAFVTITSATVPRKIAEKTILAERDTDPNIVQLSKKVIDNIKVNCSDDEIAKESRRTLQPGWYGEVQTNSSPGRIRAVAETAETEEEYPSETVAAVSSNTPPYRSNYPQRGRGIATRGIVSRGVASRGRGASNVSSGNRPIICFLCKANHFIRDCPHKAKSIPRGHCGACAGSGHRATHHAKMPPNGWPFNLELQCMRCQGRGHTKRECPSQYNDSPTTQTQAHFGEYDGWPEWQDQEDGRD